jgi:hypothetical protein
VVKAYRGMLSVRHGFTYMLQIPLETGRETSDHTKPIISLFPSFLSSLTPELADAMDPSSRKKPDSGAVCLECSDRNQPVFKKRHIISDCLPLGSF